MGYYTDYELVVIEGDSSLIEELVSSCDEAAYAIEENGDCYQGSKWYDHDKDMIKFSLLHKSAVFELSGEGESNDDLWKTYYKAGKLQHCKAKIAFDEFDERKLSSLIR